MELKHEQKNPGNGQDKTWKYKLHLDVLNRLLEHRKCKNELSEFNAEQHLRSDSETTKPQQNRKQRIAFPAWVAVGITMSGGFVYTPSLDAVALHLLMRRFAHQLKQ
ncbi:hypothetical protein NIES2100_62920 [Calothrix sp. NIES-2100]|nr:hypothetical protein NIES2100_62920 [Calothrix sp. NIES-2100]